MDETEVGGDAGHPGPMAELVEAAIGRVEALLMRDHSERYTETSLAGLDELTGGGLNPGDVTVIAGQAGSGKTALLLGIAGHAALEGKRRVAAFFPSLRPAEAVELMMLSRAGLSAEFLRKGHSPNKGELKSVQATARALAGASMHIDPGGDDPLEERIRKVMTAFTPDVVVVDDFWPDDHMGTGVGLLKRLAVQFSASFVVGLQWDEGHTYHHDFSLPHVDVLSVSSRTERGILLTVHKNRRGPLGAFLTPVPVPWENR